MAHLTVVEPEPHVLLLDAESLGQVEVDVLDGAHAAEAACVGQHPLQRSVGGRHVTWKENQTIILTVDSITVIYVNDSQSWMYLFVPFHKK